MNTLTTDPSAAGAAAPLRTALVGVGANIFSGHRPACQLPLIEVVGAADLSRERGAARAAELGCPFFTDHQELLTATRPEFTVVLTPHPFHAQIAIDALRAGSHVLVEKPMAVHVGEADAMIAAAEANGRLLAVNFQQRLRPEVAVARQMVASGQLGALQRVELTEPWLRTAAYYRAAGWRGTWRGEGGGVTMNQAPHGLDLVCHLAGMPARVVAWTRTMRHAIETEDTVLAILEWPNGALGSLFFSTAEAGSRRLQLVGSGGRLTLGESSLAWERYSSDLRSHIAHHPGPFDAPTLEPMPLAVTPAKGDHVAVYQDLYGAIVHGRPLSADGSQGRMSLELANAILLAGHTGATVEFPLDRTAYAGLLQRLQRGSAA